MSDTPNLCMLPVAALPPSDAEGPALGLLPFGVQAVDVWLNGGLRRGGVHEFYAAPDGERSAATALALLLGARACPIAGAAARPLLWLRVAGGKSGGCPHAPGLAELGVDPDAVLLMNLPDIAGLLVAAVESVRHGAAGAVVLEAHGRAPRLDLTASRRLALAAERSGTTVLMVRSGAAPMPSAAYSRWEVASAPSAPLAADAPGHPVFDLRLLRQRRGRDGLHVQLEWNREQAVFRAPLSGRPPALPAGRTADRRGRRAA